MPYNVKRAQVTADRQIKRFGAGSIAYLIRSGSKRRISAAILDFDPRARDLVLEGARRILISALDPTTGAALALPPDHEKDTVEFNKDVFRIIAPVRGPRPAGVVIFYELEGLYDSRNV